MPTTLPALTHLDRVLFELAEHWALGQVRPSQMIASKKNPVQGCPIQDGIISNPPLSEIDADAGVAAPTLSLSSPLSAVSSSGIAAELKNHEFITTLIVANNDATRRIKAARVLQTAFRKHAVRRRYRHMKNNSAEWKHLLQSNEAVSYSSLVVQVFARSLSSSRTLWGRFQRLFETPRRVHLVATTRLRLFTVDAVSKTLVSEICFGNETRVDMCVNKGNRFHIFVPTGNSRGENAFGFIDILCTASANTNASATAASLVRECCCVRRGSMA